MRLNDWLRLPVLLGTSALLSLTACGGGDDKDPEPPPPAALTCDTEAYKKAVREAAEPSAENVVTNLVAITDTNTNLVWNEGKTHVRMVVWTDFNGYKTTGDFLMTREVWMTTAPQVQRFCKTVASDKLVPRINQYLGLPPAVERDNNRFFVEMWVKPENLFRPCPDSEISDSTCGLTFPSGVTTDHRNWINANYASSYGFWQTTQYPWTGLGYTYDWCNADTRVGASEFVVRANSTVIITGTYERGVYCAP